MSLPEEANLIYFRVGIVHDEQDTITSLLTEDPDKGLLERLTKKLNKGTWRVSVRGVGKTVGRHCRWPSVLL